MVIILVIMLISFVKISANTHTHTDKPTAYLLHQSMDKANKVVGKKAKHGSRPSFFLRGWWRPKSELKRELRVELQSSGAQKHFYK